MTTNHTFEYYFSCTNFSLLHDTNTSRYHSSILILIPVSVHLPYALLTCSVLLSLVRNPALVDMNEGADVIVHYSIQYLMLHWKL